jgi:serine/threonine protein kinase
MVTQASTTTDRGALGMWLRPALVALVLGAVGLVVVMMVEGARKDSLRNRLQTILDADVHALEIWRDGQKRMATALAGSPGINRRLVAVADGSREHATPEALRAVPAQGELRRNLAAICEDPGHEHYTVTDRNGRVVSASDEARIGSLAGGVPGEAVKRALRGEPYLSIPFRRDGDGDPVMIVTVPVRAASGEIRATLTFWLHPEREFTQILHVAQSGETGETYAFDRDGVMLNDTRFREDLDAIGLLDADDRHGAILTVDVRDPGGNMVEGFRPSVDRRGLPLTRMAASAVAGNGGVDVDGYRDYRGVQVVGAWTWLEDAGMGVTTEVDREEAFRSTIILRTAFGIMWGLLMIAGMGVALYSYFVGRLQRRIARAERKAEKLGQYTLLKKIGAGGMGEVYLAKHSLLRRPTAVKLLHPERSDEHSLIRFEREVQQSSRLTHPNTISIYDYGRTPDGTFYYAMEYLDGIGLDRLVKGEGPLSEGRLIYILRQACASLHEAHDLGLIHRDIKPGNLMLCRSGGMYDVVKVLDFGLVKDLAGGDSVELSVTGAITGTPLYLSPESIKDARSVDARSDIYSVGAVAYYLLTGEHVFGGESTVELIMHHVRTPPERPSKRFGRSYDAELEEVILRCLEKSPEDRFASAMELLDALAACEAAAEWDHHRARSWWEENAERLRRAYEISLPSTPGTPMSHPDLAVDLDGRLTTDG